MTKVIYQQNNPVYIVFSLYDRNEKKFITVVSQNLIVHIGDMLSVEGFWNEHQRYGQQLIAQKIQATKATYDEVILRFLNTGFIHGIGPVYAKKIIQLYGDQSLEIIEKNPEKLLKIRGIGSRKLQQIKESWKNTFHIKDLILFFSENNLPTNAIFKLHKIYGDQAQTVIQNNPYKLIEDIHGISFERADRIAQKVGFSPTSTERIQAGLYHITHLNIQNGHCGIETKKLIIKTKELLNIEEEKIEQTLYSETLSNNLVIDQLNEIECVFPLQLYQMSKNIAHWFLNKKPKALEIDSLKKLIGEKEKASSLSLSKEQKKAIQSIFSSQYAILTGGPGVGKTTIVKIIVDIFKEKHLRVILGAPTGRAAKKLKESTNIEAKTLHRLLEIEPKEETFKRNSENPIKGDVFIIDECSMIDTILFNQLLQAIPSHAYLVLVGDHNQLPSIGPGQVFRDLCTSQSKKLRKILNIAELTQIFRQAKTSQIIVNAHQIKENHIPSFDNYKEGNDCFFIRCQSQEKAISNIEKLLLERIPEKLQINPKHDIQIITPIKSGQLGTRNLNQILQKWLNKSEQFIEYSGFKYSIGDKVMQIKNNYTKDIYNGDIGYIESIDTINRTMRIDYQDNIISYEANELDQITLSYAMTIHKSQGSEYQAIIIPVIKEHQFFLTKNLIYTALTRGKKMVVFVGDIDTLNLPISHKKETERLSKLKEWL